MFWHISFIEGGVSFPIHEGHMESAFLFFLKISMDKIDESSLNLDIFSYEYYDKGDKRIENTVSLHL